MRNGALLFQKKRKSKKKAVNPEQGHFPPAYHAGRTLKHSPCCRTGRRTTGLERPLSLENQ